VKARGKFVARVAPLVRVGGATGNHLALRDVVVFGSGRLLDEKKDLQYHAMALVEESYERVA
jgi:hypothetical protein